MKEKKAQIGSLDEMIQSPIFMEYKRRLEEKNKTVKQGTNVVHLNCYDEFTDETMMILNSSLKSAGLEFSWYDKSGVAYAGLEEYTLMTYIVVQESITQDILKGIAASAIWETIKNVTVLLWQNLKEKKINKLRYDSEVSERIKFGIQIKLDNNTHFNFELKGDVSSETIDNSLKQVLEFLNEQKPNPEYQIPDYVRYSEVEGRWIKTDVMAEIRKKHTTTIKKRPKKKK